MLFGFLKSKPNNNERFLSEEEAQQDLVPGQIASNYPLMDLLMKHGVTENDKLRVEFAFLTNDKSKAENLKSALSSIPDYRVEEIEKIQKLWRLTGWSDKILMNVDEVNHWTFNMCKIGFDHDCKFDGWGTFPEKKTE